MSSPAPTAGSVTVSTEAALVEALKSAHSGETILLVAGTYSGVSLNDLNIAGNVTVQPVNSSALVTFDGLSISSCNGLVFKGISLHALSSNGPFAFNVASSSNISFQNMNVQGTLNGNPGNDVAGFYIHGCNNISITGSSFQQFSTAITELNNTNITISNNSFHNIETDGIDNAGSSFVNISDNQFSDFTPVYSTVHPDAIQFWTAGTTTSAHDINISQNTISVGSGGQTQGIFIKDEVGDLPYKNISITNNVVIGELYNSIAVGHTDGLYVENNSVTASAIAGANSLNSPSTGTAHTAWIDISDSTDVSLGGNNSPTYQLDNNSLVTQVSPNSINGVKQLPTMYSAVSATLGNLSSTLVLTGNSPISGGANNAAGSTVIANNAGDRLYDNGAGSQNLVGGAGNDTLIARFGSDTLTGNGGNNTFSISDTVQHVTITDFDKAGTHNTLDLSSFLNAGLSPIMTSSNVGTTIEFHGSASVITLLGVSASELSPTKTGFTH